MQRKYKQIWSEFLLILQILFLYPLNTYYATQKSIVVNSQP